MCWKFYNVVFQQEGHHNYAKEGLTLTIFSQILSEPEVEEIKWSQTTNTTGPIGNNIPRDLHMEHLNHWSKVMMSTLGSNTLQGPFQHVAKFLRVVNRIC